MSYMNNGNSGYPRSPAAGAAPSAPPPDDHHTNMYYPSASSPANMNANRSSFTHQQQPQQQMQMPPPVPVNVSKGGAYGAPIAVSMGYAAQSPSSSSFASASYGSKSPMGNNNMPANYLYPQATPVPGSPSGNPAPALFGQGAPVPGGLPNHPSMHGGFGPVTPHTGPRPAPLMPMAPAGSTPIAPPAPSSVVALRFRCKNLKTRDVFSESDPFIVVYVEEGTHQWREIGRTETVDNCANPTFTKAMEIDYFFEEVQRLRLEVFDRDSSSEQLSAHDFLGCVELTMAQLMATNGQSMVLALLQNHSKHVHGLTGHVVIDAEELSMCADQVAVQFGADKLDNTDGWFSKSDPFLNIYRLKDEHVDPKLPSSWLHVWRSPHILNNLNPRWPKVTLGVRSLCNGNLRRLLKFECMDWEASGRHQFIGSCTMTAAEFVAGERLSLDLINSERQARKGKRYKNSGVLRILAIECFKLNTFAEYLRGGCEISLIVGVDYTASNGAVSDPTSLHFMGGNQFGQRNDYQSAIAAAGAILEPYDHDKRFPVYGFGAMVNGVVNHCFPLTFDPNQPEVEGVQGILRAYGDSFPFVSLHGPTYFAPLIRQAATIAQLFSQPATAPLAPGTPVMPHGAQQQLKYFVLLIITDGAIMDMENTVEELVSASQLPLSIVIVGVGNADFSAMDALDADGKLLRARSGRTAARDIVQFVPFNRYRSNPARLAKETLAEIPLQLTQHFRVRGIKPHAPLQRAGTEMLIQNATGAANNLRATGKAPTGALQSQV